MLKHRTQSNTCMRFLGNWIKLFRSWAYIVSGYSIRPTNWQCLSMFYTFSIAKWAVAVSTPPVQPPPPTCTCKYIRLIRACIELLGVLFQQNFVQAAQRCVTLFSYRKASPIQHSHEYIHTPKYIHYTAHCFALLIARMLFVRFIIHVITVHDRAKQKNFCPTSSDGCA